MRVLVSDRSRREGHACARINRSWLTFAVLAALASTVLGQAPEPDPDSDSDEVPVGLDPASTTNETITSGKSEVKMLEDGTVADALQRRPDLRFGNVTVDGQESNVSLASMSSAAVENVEVLKAVTPDVDADSLGGSVSVRSKPAFDQVRRTFQGRLTFEYDFGIDEIDPDATLTLGDAFGSERQWGALFTLRGEIDASGSDNRRIEWMNLETEEGELRVMDRLSFYQWRNQDREAELNGTIDHRVNEHLSLFLRGNYVVESSEIYEPNLVLRFGDGEFVEASDSGALVEDVRVKRNLLAFESEREAFSVAFGGYFVTDSIDGDFRIFYESSDYLEPDFFIIEFEQPGLDMVYGLEDRDYPTIEQVDGDSLYDPDAYAFDEMLSEVWSHKETDLIGTLNLKVDHGLGLPENGYWKAGAKMRLREIDQFSDATLHDVFDGDYRQSEVLGDYADDDFLDGRYTLEPATGWPEAPDFRDAHLDQFVVNERRTREISDPATYDASEQIMSGYGMASFETGPFRFLVGLRYEQTNIDYTGREVIIDEDGNYESTQVRTGSSAYGNPFPGIHARYRINDRLVLIGSWTETIDRPDYNDLVPYRYVDRENREVEEGNPELKPALLTNFDLALDFTTSAAGLLSLEVFSKEVSDFFYWQESIHTEGPYAGYLRERLENGPDASMVGVELNWAQGLGFVHEYLAPWSFNINLLLRQTSIRYPSRPEKEFPLAGLPDEELTIAVSYEKAWFFGQFELTQTSDSLERVGRVEEEDRFAVGRTRIDIDTTYEIFDGVKLIAELHNLTASSDDVNYEYDPRYSTRLSLESRKALLGVRWDL